MVYIGRLVSKMSRKGYVTSLECVAEQNGKCVKIRGHCEATLSLPPGLAGLPDPRDPHPRRILLLFRLRDLRTLGEPAAQLAQPRRSYKEGVLSFIRYRGIVWPQEASSLLLVPVEEVQEYRDALTVAGAAPKTINHRVSALCSFYKYLALSAAELRLPIVVPNPAHSQFIARESSDPREETLSLPAAPGNSSICLPAIRCWLTGTEPS